MLNNFSVRIFEQFMRMLAAIILSRKEKKYEYAYQQIEQGSRYFLEADLATIVRLKPDELVKRYENDLDRGMICANLLYELALICEVRGETVAAEHMRGLSLPLFESIIPKDKLFQTQENLDKLESLR